MGEDVVTRCDRVCANQNILLDAYSLVILIVLKITLTKMIRSS